MENKKYLIVGLVSAFIILSVGVMYWIAMQDASSPVRPVDHFVVTNFEECVAAGYPVMESYPRQCSDGTNTFEETVVPESYPLETKPEPISGEREKDGCVITGCNGEVCVSEETSQLMGVTPCIYKPEFACFNESVCSHDASGECAWQETPEFIACIEQIRTGSETKSREVPFELGGACTDGAQCIGGACVLDGDEGGTGHCIDPAQIDGCAMVLAGGEAVRQCFDVDLDHAEELIPPQIR